MDYTPGIFKLRNYASDSSKHVHTTLAKQLALYVTIFSPVQMVAGLPENYKAKPDAFRFIKEVPVGWDDTKILEEEPGDFITISRKEKGGTAWFIGAITYEHSRNATVNLSFLDKGKRYIATIIEDGADADWQQNPEAYKIETKRVSAETILKIKLAPGGGAAISTKMIN